MVGIRVQPDFASGVSLWLLAGSVYRVYFIGMKSADLIKELMTNGWTLDRVRGSHHVYVHPDNPNIITVPHPKKDLGKGLVNNLRRIAGLK